MKLEMAKDSLFAILLRKPWWISIGIAAGIALVARAMLPEQYVIAGALGGIPFMAIGAIAAWRQLRAPSAARITSTLEAIGTMSWREFASALEEAFRRDGYAVTRIAGPQADFEIVKAGRTSLVSGKRWKAANTGVLPLRESAPRQRTSRGTGEHLHRGRQHHRQRATLRGREQDSHHRRRRARADAGERWTREDASPQRDPEALRAPPCRRARCLAAVRGRAGAGAENRGRLPEQLSASRATELPRVEMATAARRRPQPPPEAGTCRRWRRTRRPCAPPATTHRRRGSATPRCW